MTAGLAITQPVVHPEWCDRSRCTCESVYVGHQSSVQVVEVEGVMEGDGSRLEFWLCRNDERLPDGTLDTGVVDVEAHLVTSLYTMPVKMWLNRAALAALRGTVTSLLREVTE